MNYQNGKIYTIKSNETHKVYFGCTTQKTLSKVLAQLHSNFRLCYEAKIYPYYSSSFAIIHYEDAYIELFQNFPCSSHKELKQRLQEIIAANNDIAVNNK